MRKFQRIPSKSPYSLKDKLRMAAWWTVEKLIFRNTPHKFNFLRCFILRRFGARIGKNTFIFSSARIWFPWNLEIGSNSGIGFDALIYNLDKIFIGEFATISQRCHLNTGSHDFTKPEFPLITSPIHVKDGAFVGTDSYIGMGVTLGEYCVVSARSVVNRDLPAGFVCGGHPCKPYRRISEFDNR